MVCFIFAFFISFIYHQFTFGIQKIQERLEKRALFIWIEELYKNAIMIMNRARSNGVSFSIIFILKKFKLNIRKTIIFFKYNHKYILISITDYTLFHCIENCILYSKCCRRIFLCTPSISPISIIKFQWTILWHSTI